MLSLTAIFISSAVVASISILDHSKEAHMPNETTDFFNGEPDTLIENIENAIIEALDNGIDRDAIALAIAELLSPFD